MEKRRLKLISKEPLTESGKIWRLKFESPGMEYIPGQFVEIGIEGFFLRRPVSVADSDSATMTLIIERVGKGTAAILETPEGVELEMLTGLGNGFSLYKGPGTSVVAGGGVGFAPLTGLLKRLHKGARQQLIAFFGFNAAADVPFGLIEEMKDGGIWVEVSTMTGEAGYRGTAIDAAKRYFEEREEQPAYFYGCGPGGMMKALCSAFECDGEVSLEARMGCGFGACMGCTIMTRRGPRRICREGPVFKKSEL